MSARLGQKIAGAALGACGELGQVTGPGMVAHAPAAPRIALQAGGGMVPGGQRGEGAVAGGQCVRGRRAVCQVLVHIDHGAIPR